uniref:Uncharacterized protein n=1 Tax=Lepeophtheirus salmonis TaxID=72036 RepID=A0A0K2UXC7_LEPSM
MIHDVNHTPLKTHQHFLCPYSIVFFHGKESAHPVCGVK